MFAVIQEYTENQVVFAVFQEYVEKTFNFAAFQEYAETSLFSKFSRNTQKKYGFLIFATLQEYVAPFSSD